MSNFLTQKVNFYISVTFIASFALYVTITGARLAHLQLLFVPVDTMNALDADG